MLFESNRNNKTLPVGIVGVALLSGILLTMSLMGNVNIMEAE